MADSKDWRRDEEDEGDQEIDETVSALQHWFTAISFSSR